MSLETDPYIYGQINFDTGPRQFKERQQFSANCTITIDIDPYFTPSTKINEKQILN